MDKRSLLLISRDPERRVFDPRVQRWVTDRRTDRSEFIALAHILLNVSKEKTCAHYNRIFSDFT
jgi:hypothetical protein